MKAKNILVSVEGTPIRSLTFDHDPSLTEEDKAVLERLVVGATVNPAPAVMEHFDDEDPFFLSIAHLIEKGFARTVEKDLYTLVLPNGNTLLFSDRPVFEVAP